MQINQDDVNDQYNNDYSDWKRWAEQGFGELKNTVRRYYDVELARTQIADRPRIRVLEVGFGNGAFLKYATMRGWDVSGVEANAILVERGVKAGFRVFDSGAIGDIRDNAFDLIVAFDVLEHVAQDELFGFLSELRRLLVDGGVLLARFPNGDSPFGLLNQNGDITHLTSIGSEKAKYFARRVGARVVYIGGEARFFFCGSIRHTLHAIVTLPIVYLINRIINIILFPGRRIAFLSLNLVLILKFDKI